MRAKHVGLVLGVALAAAAAGRGHELKVLASRHGAEVGDRVTVYLSWGHVLPVDDLVDGQTLERYEVLSPNGDAANLPVQERSLQASPVILESPGAYRAVAARRPSVLTFVVGTDGGRQMRRGPKSAVKGETVDHALRSRQFATAVLLAGPPGREAVKPVGLPLEVVPIDPPAGWREGAELRFQVLSDGKPAAGEQVLATYVGFRPDNAWCYATSTDSRGVATVRASRAGTWVLRVNLRKPAPPAAREEYDYESCTSTLTLEVRP